MTNASRFALVATLLLSAGAARAAAPLTFTYSGYLTDAAGAPATASTTLDFQFFDLGTGGTLLGHEYNVGVTPNADGYFSVILGAGYVGDTPATLTFEKLFGFPTFMAVKYGTTEPYMTQRVPLTSVPSAMSVAWSGVTGFPAPCGPGTVLTGFDSTTGGALCVTDADSGTITGVTAGTGLTGGGTTGTVTLSVSPTAVQTRVGGTCAIGSSIRVINQDGTVSCQTDTNSGGTVTGVTASLPLSSSGGTAPNLTISQAGTAANGYLSSTDWNTFNGKLSSVSRDTSLAGAGTAASPLTVAYSGTGGRLGTAASAARSDHGHGIHVPVALDSFYSQFGSPMLGTFQYGTFLAVPAWTLPPSSCILTSVTIPAGYNSALPPTLNVNAGMNAAAAASVTLDAGGNGVAADLAGPSNCIGWAPALTATVGVARMHRFQFAMNASAFNVCGTAANAGPGDSLNFRLCNFMTVGSPSIMVTSVALEYP